MLRFEASANRAFLSGHGDADRRGPAAPDYELEMRACCGADDRDQRMDVFHAVGLLSGLTSHGQDVGIGVGQVSIAPGNFRSTVTGTTVRLDWDPVLEPVITYLVQAGSAPGLSNLANLLTGNAAASLVVNGVPPGSVFRAGAGRRSRQHSRARIERDRCDRRDRRLVPRVAGRLDAASDEQHRQSHLAIAVVGDPAASYIVEAGSSPGQNNIVVFDTGSATTALTAVAPDGTDDVRVRGRNSCGTGPVSNEVIVTVPSGAAPPQPAPPISNLIPEVAVSAATLGPPSVVAGPRPNAGAGPALAVQPAPATNDILRTFRLNSSQLFDSIVITGDTVLARNFAPAGCGRGWVFPRQAGVAADDRRYHADGWAIVYRPIRCRSGRRAGRPIRLWRRHRCADGLLLHRDADIRDDPECRQHVLSDGDDRVGLHVDSILAVLVHHPSTTGH